MIPNRRWSGSALIKADRREQESLDYRQPSAAEAATKPILEPAASAFDRKCPPLRCKGVAAPVETRFGNTSRRLVPRLKWAQLHRENTSCFPGEETADGLFFLDPSCTAS